MNILIIRHGEPDYANDSITERGADDARRLAAIIDRYHSRAGHKLVPAVVYSEKSE